MFPRIATSVCLPALLAGALLAPAGAPEVRVDAILVHPASPAPAALCELKVRLKNAGSRTASYFRFNVKIDGQEVPVYKLYDYAVEIAPGTTAELALNNFYSPPQAKTFEIQVTLTEAQWVEVKKDGKNSTTTPAGAVAGLPTGATWSVKMSPSKS
jgi:hypothetical protein